MIDYRQARILDARWWKHVWTLLEALDRQTHSKALDASYRFTLALVANGSLTEKSFDDQQNSAKERYFDLVGTWRPWEGASYTKRKAKEFKADRQAYIDAFGVDPADPKYKAWEAQRLEDIAAGKFDGNTGPSSEELVAQRMREREQKGGSSGRT